MPSPETPLFYWSSLPSTRGTRNTLTLNVVVLILSWSDTNRLCAIHMASESVMSWLGTEGTKCDPDSTVLSWADPVFFGSSGLSLNHRLQDTARRDVFHDDKSLSMFIHSLKHSNTSFLNAQRQHNDTSCLGCSPLLDGVEVEVLKHQSGVLCCSKSTSLLAGMQQATQLEKTTR